MGAITRIRHHQKITCGTCDRTIDGAHVKLATESLNPETGIGTCKRCLAEPMCDECNKSPIPDGVRICKVVGKDVGHRDAQMCVGCISDAQRIGLDVRERISNPMDPEDIYEECSVDDLLSLAGNVPEMVIPVENDGGNIDEDEDEDDIIECIVEQVESACSIIRNNPDVVKRVKRSKTVISIERMNAARKSGRMRAFLAVQRSRYA